MRQIGLQGVLFGICLAVALSACAALPADSSTQEEQRMAQGIPALAPGVFADQVAAAGGRVDYVFGDDRPFPECHASTVVQAVNGDLICAWFGGTKEKDPDVGVWYSRFSGGVWTQPTRAAKVNETAHWNPVLFRDAEGVVYLFFKVGPEIPFWQTYWMRTENAGLTWSEPLELVAGDKGGRGPVKNKPIILANGAWLAPASTEHQGWKPFADISTDRGQTWTRSDDWRIDRSVLKGKGAIQPSFWESAPGTVHALLRSAAGRAWRADSEDGGRTWSEVRATDIPNNNSGLDVLLLEDGRLLMVYNPISKNWGPRTPLDLAVSTDNGHTWASIAHLEDDPEGKGEFSYPAIVRTEDGVAITYTWRRERIRCWQIPLAALGQ